MKNLELRQTILLDDCLQPLKDEEMPNIKRPELYDVYKAWCKDEGYTNVIGSIKFYKELCEYYNLNKNELFYHIKRGYFLDRYTLNWETFSKYEHLLVDSVIPIRENDL